MCSYCNKRINLKGAHLVENFFKASQIGIMNAFRNKVGAVEIGCMSRFPSPAGAGIERGGTRLIISRPFRFPARSIVGFRTSYLLI